MSSKQRRLTKREIAFVLDFLQPNPYIPSETALSICALTKKDLEKQLKTVEIIPELIPKLKKRLRKDYFATLVQPGECVGIITAQSICERQTQMNLNTFHKAGSGDKQPIVSKFAEMLNATTKPKAPSYLIRFRNSRKGNDTVQALRETIGHDIVQISLKKIAKSFEIILGDSESSGTDDDDAPYSRLGAYAPWYPIFLLLNDIEEIPYTDCISIDIDMDMLYEYRITLRQIAEKITYEYADTFCVYSPDCYGRLDVYFDTQNINVPDDIEFVNEENYKQIYLEEVAQPNLENMILFGIPGITAMYFIKEEGSQSSSNVDSQSSSNIPLRSTWSVETENSRVKVGDSSKEKKKKLDFADRFKRVLVLPSVDPYRTYSNSIWDIYHTFGIEAVRQYMINEFSKLMEGINLCHISLLVDKMTYKGAIHSVSRYSMAGNGSVLQNASFERVLDCLLTSSSAGEKEVTNGVSSAIVSGKRPRIGTGMCDLEMNLEKMGVE